MDDAVYTYENVTRPYWGYERKYVEDKYETVEFAYDLLSAKTLIQVHWQREDLLGYISSGSAIQKLLKCTAIPITIIEEEIKKIWPEGEVKKVVFPIYLKLNGYPNSKCGFY
jgi:hypothetical protein